MCVVVEPAAGHEGRQLAGEAFQSEAGNEAGQIVGVGADVADRAAGTGPVGIDAPAGLLGAFVLGPARQPVLDIDRVDDTDRTEFARRHHRAGLPDHRVAGVIVGEHEELPRAGRDGREIARLRERRRQRLVADDVEAGFEERLRDRKMQVVGRDDRHRFDAVRPLLFSRRHRDVIVVAARRVEADVGRRGMRLLRRRGERAGDQFEAIVDPAGDPVDATDEGALPATDHAQPDAPGSRRALSFDRHHHLLLSSTDGKPTVAGSIVVDHPVERVVLDATAVGDQRLDAGFAGHGAAGGRCEFAHRHLDRGHHICLQFKVTATSSNSLTKIMANFNQTYSNMRYSHFIKIS